MIGALTDTCQVLPTRECQPEQGASFTLQLPPEKGPLTWLCGVDRLKLGDPGADAQVSPLAIDQVKR